MKWGGHLYIANGHVAHTFWCKWHAICTVPDVNFDSARTFEDLFYGKFANFYFKKRISVKKLDLCKYMLFMNREFFAVKSVARNYPISSPLRLILEHVLQKLPSGYNSYSTCWATPLFALSIYSFVACAPHFVRISTYLFFIQQAYCDCNVVCGLVQVMKVDAWPWHTSVTFIIKYEN